VLNLLITLMGNDTYYAFAKAKLAKIEKTAKDPERERSAYKDRRDKLAGCGCCHHSCARGDITLLIRGDHRQRQRWASGFLRTSR